MKRATADKNLKKVIQRIHDVSGIFETPMCSHEYLKIKRVWVFGSFAKGSDSPNDLDVLVELIEPNNPMIKQRGIERKSRRKLFRRSGSSSELELHGGFIGYKKKGSFGIPHVISSKNELCKYLRAGTKNTSIHFTNEEKELLSKLDVKILVYPRNDFTEQTTKR